MVALNLLATPELVLLDKFVENKIWSQFVGKIMVQRPFVFLDPRPEEIIMVVTVPENPSIEKQKGFPNRQWQ